MNSALDSEQGWGYNHEFMVPVVEGETLTEILMPEGLCARCNVEEPAFFECFSTRRMGDEATVELGFCSNDCRNSFVRGIPAVQSLPNLPANS